MKFGIIFLILGTFSNAYAVDNEKIFAQFQKDFCHQEWIEKFEKVCTEAKSAPELKQKIKKEVDGCIFSPWGYRAAAGGMDPEGGAYVNEFCGSNVYGKIEQSLTAYFLGASRAEAKQGSCASSAHPINSTSSER